MKLLIDTHVFIWLATDDQRLSKAVRDRLGSPGEDIYLSVVSRWEIGLKQRSSDFHLPLPFALLMERSGYRGLGMEFDVPALAERLPEIHADPFDRILIAQALFHDLTLVTADKTIHHYPVPTFW